jgi:lysophospholipase L1-like esterase
MRLRIAGLVLLVLAGWAPAGVAAVCPTGPQALMDLPQTRAAMRRGEPIVVLAIGSSSTRGAGASGAERSYPAVLQGLLGAALADQHVAVVNRGIDGQDAPEQVARLQGEIAALRPQLVIWQVGANAALRRLDPAQFRTTLLSGVQLVRQAQADVVLMDSQRAPRIIEEPHHLRIDAALREAAVGTATPLFSRGALMDAWGGAGFAPALFLTADRLHHNDLGYRCVAEALGRAVLRALGRD